LNKVFSSKHNTAATTSGHRLFPDKLGRLIATDDIYLENKKYPNILISNSGIQIAVKDSGKEFSQYILGQNEKYEASLNSKLFISSDRPFGALIENLEPPRLINLLRDRLNRGALIPLGYKNIWANSAFTASWIRSNWEIDCVILYPPVRIGYETSNEFLSRDPLKILSVGRFMDPKNGHSKNQLELIKAFKILLKDFAGEFELHLAGGVDAKNQKYFDKRIDELKSKRDTKKRDSKKHKQLNNKKRKLELTEVLNNPKLNDILEYLILDDIDYLYFNISNLIGDKLLGI
jgi:glycosyltransferase involved in cell wall biosynthesis